MKENRLRKLLDEGKPTIGTHAIIPWPRVLEAIGHSGAFDYIEYVGEYSTFDMEKLEDFSRAIELFPNMSSMIKVEEQTRGFIATRALDAGIQNVLFTDCRSAEDVRECVRYVRPETPEDGGVHGAGLRRTMLGSNPGAWIKSMQDAVIAVMIEKKGAMEELDEILSIKGVDMLQFGPLDYSISMGKLDKIRTPEIQDVQKEMIKKALAAGVRPRVEIGTSEQAKPFLDLGVRDFCVGHDLMIILNWCQEQGGEMRKLLESV